jgi:DNA-binding FrmR family transcriptional regulator
MNDTSLPIEVAHQDDEAHSERCDYNRKTLNRIRRMKGQLNALERLIEADGGSCEERVIQARTIEKAAASLITHLVSCYLENTARHEMSDAPDKVVTDLSRIIELLHK